MSATIDAAIAAAETGLAVIFQSGKKPFASGWNKGPANTPEHLRATYKKGLNIAFRAGPTSIISGDAVAVLDVDLRSTDEADKDAADAAYAELVGAIEPTVATGGNGFHLYLRMPADRLPAAPATTLRQSLTRLPPEDSGKPGKPTWTIELLAAEHAVTMPPSIHPSGNPYRWLNGGLAHVPVAPESLLLALSALASDDRDGAEASTAAVAVLDSENRQRKQADVLTDIGREHVLFRDTSGTAYARVVVNDHQEVHPIESAAYREVLAEAFLRLAGKGCNRNSMSDALLTLSSLARFKGETHRVWVRTAETTNGIVLDMGRPDWRCIEVDANGWRWCASPPMFRRAGAALPLPDPKEPDFGRLWKHANVCTEHRPLVAGFMLAALRPSGPYPQLHLSGEQGTGKSTLARVIKNLVDPSASPLRAPPKEVRDLLVGALNGWCIALDNLSFLTPQLSDGLCRLSTGGAISERTLYSNTDETLVEVQRPVILNGIEDLATRPDLADRGLHIELEVIKTRKPESAFWAEFEVDAPHVFSALLDGLVLAIRNHQAMEIGPLPRMADFAAWAAAGMPALGFTVDEFVSAYQDNVATGLGAAIDTSPVGGLLVDFMQARAAWSGTASELLAALGQGVDDSTKRSQGWPKSPRGLSSTIRRLAPALRHCGIGLTKSRAADASRTRTFVLCNRDKQPSEQSRTSAVPQLTEEVVDGSDDLDGQIRSLHNECAAEATEVIEI